MIVHEQKSIYMTFFNGIVEDNNRQGEIMEVKLQHIHVNDEEFEELESIKRDLTRPYTGSELTKIMGYILAGLIIISAIAPILF